MASLFDRHLKEKREKAKAKKRERQPIEQSRSSVESNPDSISTLTVERLSHDGRGVAKDQHGKVTFIAGALPGEQVNVQISASHSRFNEGLASTIKVASPHRRPPHCEYFSVCGGCSLQHLAADEQVKFKQKITQEQLQHQTETRAVLPLPEQDTPLVAAEYGYRRKARLALTETRSQKFSAGFRARDSKQIIAIHHCPVLCAELQPLLPQLQAFLPQLQGRAHIGHVELIAAEPQPRILVRLLRALSAHDERSWREFSQQHRVTVVFAESTDKSKKSLRYRQLDSAQLLPLMYSISDIKLEFQAHDFLQVNAVINQQMVAQAMDWLQPQPDEVGLDLFCGFGNFTLPLARHVKKMTGVEGVTEQVHRATSNAALNRISNAEFIASDLQQPLSKARWASQSYDFILLDPPRTGAIDICRQITELNTKRILYVSCNPATLARDAAELVAQGYEIERYGVMDMFPQTAHSETMILFKRS
ncbi:MAG: 23S rRNA (uracil(1939)-C(5))-methyltransferase RlmD [Aliidiomarina sp.]|uniref:23S rRNA (uracil(1939)-C(5))-methyltransferase RlmD n=1 Tax=Aliidiomarina sp. TaxID=1872439 RepID=UPI0025B81045|nr:23S rRNA (uracil(1939)-C(5))-methyltransferase RlmD [Aliidiomarina sp.]MCH8502167.1 23S rRNA (uracil(1939)-C(5))-methyltransferase RlmD [Aliidiomarina sp.]